MSSNSSQKASSLAGGAVWCSLIRPHARRKATEATSVTSAYQALPEQHARLLQREQYRYGMALTAPGAAELRVATLLVSSRLGFRSQRLLLWQDQPVPIPCTVNKAFSILKAQRGTKVGCMSLTSSPHKGPSHFLAMSSESSGKTLRIQQCLILARHSSTTITGIATLAVMFAVSCTEQA